MRKKIILINALTTFFSLIILLITSGFLIYIRNLNNYENAAKNYLSFLATPLRLEKLLKLRWRVIPIQIGTPFS